MRRFMTLLRCGLALTLTLAIVSACSNKTVRVAKVDAYETIPDLADEIAATLADAYKGKKRKVLVANFLYENRQFLRIGRLLADRVEDQLVDAPKFEILSGIDLQNILIKLKLKPGPGLFAPDNAGIIAGAVGADALVVGNITDMGPYFAVSTRLLDASSGTVLAAAQYNLVNKAGNLVNQFAEDEAVTPSYAGRYRDLFKGRWERYGDSLSGMTVDVEQDEQGTYYAIIHDAPYRAREAGLSSGEVKWQKLRPTGWNVFEGESLSVQPGVYRSDGGADNVVTPLQTVPVEICVDGSGERLVVLVQTTPETGYANQTWRRLF